MAKMIVGVLDTSQEARAVVEELIANGFNREAIGFLALDFQTEDSAGRRKSGEKDIRQSSAIGALTGLIGMIQTTVSGIGPVMAAGPLAAALNRTPGGSRGLATLGIPEQEADYFAESVADGSTLISITTDNDSAERAADIIRRQGISAAERERQQHQQAPEPTRQPEQAASPPLPVERPAPGPIAVAPSTPPPREGAVRIYGQVYETPAEQQLRLREERAALEGGAAARGQDLRQEEAERGSYRTEAASQTKKKTPRASILGEEQPGIGPDERLLRAEDDDFRRHFRSSFAKQGERYRDYRSAYYYASNRSHDQEYQGKEWSEVEEEIHREWDRTHPGTWTRFREALHFAWDRSRHTH